jgi:FkbM family methyltransferase
MQTSVSPAKARSFRHKSSRLAYATRVAYVYWRFVSQCSLDVATPADLLKLMRVRLAQSKVGKFICPQPIVSQVRLRAFGKSPVNVRSHTTDISVLAEIIVACGYDALIRHPLANPAFIVDLGANIGLVDRWLLKRYPGVEIVAVEPEPGNAATLRANVRGLTVNVIEAAIGAHPRTVRLHSVNGEHGFTMVGEPEAGAQVVDVPVVTLESIVGTSRQIDLLKVDIEGAEEELFADCASWIGRVQTLLVECHGRYKRANLLADLRRAGAEFEVVEWEEKSVLNMEVGLLTRAATAASPSTPGPH